MEKIDKNLESATDQDNIAMENRLGGGGAGAIVWVFTAITFLAICWIL